jgi:DNA end-binding protein Ku
MPKHQVGETFRPAWSGFLRFSLVSIPVQAVPAKISRKKIELNWLHSKCMNRIHYKKVCSLHGEVPENEIISGFKVAKEEYIPIKKEELGKLRSQKEDTINVDVFVSNDAVEPLQFSDSNYYLLPDGKAGEKPYAAFHQSMLHLKASGIAQVVLFRRQQLVMIRPHDDILIMTVLHHQEEIRQPTLVAKDITHTKVTPKELELVENLIEGATVSDFVLSDYHDVYEEKLHELIDARKKGKEFVIAEEEDEPQAIDFTQALKQSLAKAKAKATSSSPRKLSDKPKRRKVS